MVWEVQTGPWLKAEASYFSTNTHTQKEKVIARGLGCGKKPAQTEVRGVLQAQQC